MTDTITVPLSAFKSVSTGALKDVLAAIAAYKCPEGVSLYVDYEMDDYGTLLAGEPFIGVSTSRGSGMCCRPIYVGRGRGHVWTDDDGEHTLPDAAPYITAYLNHERLEWDWTCQCGRTERSPMLPHGWRRLDNYEQGYLCNDFDAWRAQRREASGD